MSSPSPLSLLAFGSRVAKRRPNAGRPGFSAATRIFVAMVMSSTSLVWSPVKSSRFDSGAGRREVTESRLYNPPSICSSAIELMPKLTPSVGRRSRLPSRPDAG